MATLKKRAVAAGFSALMVTGDAAAESLGSAPVSALADLGTTVILATREAESVYSTPGSSAVFGAEDFLERGSVDLIDALQREPGVSLPFDVAGVDGLVPYLQGGTNAINIRGLEGNRVNLMVDGIRQPEDFTARSFEGAGGPGRVYFDPAVFAQLEIFKSATSSLYGSDALAGTVEGRTEGPDTLLGEGLAGRVLNSSTIYADQNSSLNQRLAGAVGNGDYAVSFVYSYREGNEFDNNSSLAPNPAEFTSHAAVVKGMWRVEEWEFTATLDGFDSESFVRLDSILGPSEIGNILASSNRGERSRYRVSLDAEWAPTGGGKFFDVMRARGYWQDSRSWNLNPQRALIDPGTPGASIRDRLNELNYDTEIAGASLAFDKGADWWGADHALTWGYDGSISWVESALRRTDFPASPNQLENMAPAEVDRHGFYFSDRIRFGERDQWVVTPSARVDFYEVTPENTPDFLNQTSFPIFDRFGRLTGTESVRAVPYSNVAFSPGLNVLYWVTDEWNVYWNGSRGIRNPSAEELMGVFQHEDDFITLPNPQLAEESSFSNEVGAQYDGPALSGQLSAYWNRYDGFIESGVQSGEFLDGREILRTVNRAEAEIYGVEFRGDWRLGETDSAWEGFHLGGSAAWSEGRTRDPGTGWQPLNTVEPWKASLWLAYDAPDAKWGANLTASYFAAKRPEDISGDIDPTGSYFLLDLIGYYRINDNVMIRGGVKNLLDSEYVLWTRANRGSGHNGGVTNGRDQQPGINGFLALELSF